MNFAQDFTSPHHMHLFQATLTSKAAQPIALVVRMALPENEARDDDAKNVSQRIGGPSMMGPSQAA